jgi:hypothetical protein
MNINVTQKDIDSGTRSSDTNCAIALAIHRSLGETLTSEVDKILTHRHDVSVGRHSIKINGVVYQLPKKGRDFIVKFDNNKATAEPFSFALRKVAQKKATVAAPVKPVTTTHSQAAVDYIANLLTPVSNSKGVLTNV